MNVDNIIPINENLAISKKNDTNTNSITISGAAHKLFYKYYLIIPPSILNKGYDHIFELKLGINTINIHFNCLMYELTGFDNFGLNIYNDNGGYKIFEIIKTLSQVELQKLKLELIKINKDFAYDVYINQDWKRKYKIKYSNKVIEID